MQEKTRGDVGHPRGYPGTLVEGSVMASVSEKNASDNRLIAVVCPRVGTVEHLPPGSITESCLHCGVPVWVDPPGQQRPNYRPCPSMILCTLCAAEALKANWYKLIDNQLSKKYSHKECCLIPITSLMDIN